MKVIKTKDDKLGLLKIESHEYTVNSVVNNFLTQVKYNTLNNIELEDGTIKMLDTEDFEIIGEIDE